MRLITVQAIRASTFCADRLRARRLRPIKSLYLWESRFHECPLAISSHGLPAHSAFVGEHLNVSVALSGLGVCDVAQDRV